jgi:dehydrogenase/reductase SDR family protein 7
MSIITRILFQQFGQNMNPTDKRMTSERCAHLTFVAIVNRLEEAWPCFFPVLPIMYFNQVSIL